MTDRGRLKQRQPVEYSRVEPLPNPSREPDMNQRRRIRAFAGILVPYFAGREDVLVSGGGYLRDDASKEDESLPLTAWWRLELRPLTTWRRATAT